jgi:hypothetical protein
MGAEHKMVIPSIGVKILSRLKSYDVLDITASSMPVVPYHVHVATATSFNFLLLSLGSPTIWIAPVSLQAISPR